MTTCVTLFFYQDHRGGGWIRTPGACARRFSRPLPSTTRPLLRANPEAGAQYRDRGWLVKSDLGQTCDLSRPAWFARCRARPGPTTHRHTERDRAARGRSAHARKRSEERMEV